MSILFFLLHLPFHKIFYNNFHLMENAYKTRYFRVVILPAITKSI